MQFYLHAFCLDEGKAQPGHEEMWVGPFDWIGLTWGFLRAGSSTDDDTGEQFTQHESGFWYPLVNIPISDRPGSSSTQSDPTRGRFTDIYTEWEPDRGAMIVPTAERTAEPGEDMTAAWAAEELWLNTPYDQEEPVSAWQQMRPIASIEELRTLAANKSIDARILLNFGAFSRKSILYDVDEAHYHIINHIDDSEQVLTEAQLYTESHIGEAIIKGALILETA